MEINDKLIQLMYINEIAFRERFIIEEEIAGIASDCFGTTFWRYDVDFKCEPFCPPTITLATRKLLSPNQLSHFCNQIGFNLLEIESCSNLAYSSTATTTYKYIFKSNYIKNHPITQYAGWELKMKK